jgi:hypothetical protein
MTQEMAQLSLQLRRRSKSGFADKAFGPFESLRIEIGSFRLDEPQRRRFLAFLASTTLDTSHEH